MIELAEMIAQLRGELAAAMAAARDAEDAGGDTLRFELGPVQLEAEFTVQRSEAADGRIRFWVVEAGASGQRAAGTTHRVSLSLTPRVGDSDQSPWVSGDRSERER
ncbi:trypco2 family protein [Streptomyces sp. NPDC059900]|uniref:trypco2 family protein n=1 Tax=Streptomyces sp. NPDC059900 TaxID=3155816 RepID=UPI0034299D76